MEGVVVEVDGESRPSCGICFPCCCLVSGSLALDDPYHCAWLCVASLVGQGTEDVPRIHQFSIKGAHN